MRKIIPLALAAILLTGGSLALASPTHLASGFSCPTGLLAAPDGSLYVAEWGAGRVTALDAAGNKTRVAAGIAAPAGLALDEAGRLYIAGYGDGTIYVQDKGVQPRVFASGFQQPTGLAWAKNGTLLVADRGAGEIVAIAGNGQKRILSSGHSLPVGVAQMPDGALFVSCYGGTLDYVDAKGKTTKLRQGFQTPGVGIISAGQDSVLGVDNAAGHVYLADRHGIKKIIVSGLNQPVGLARLANADLAVATWGDNAIHTVEAQND